VPEFSSEACLCCSRSGPLQQVLGRVVGQNVQCPLDARTPRRSRHVLSGAGWRRRSWPGGFAVARTFAPHPAFLPGHDRFVRADPGEQRCDRVAVAHHDPSLPRTSRALARCQAPPDADERQRASAEGQLISNEQAGRVR